MFTVEVLSTSNAQFQYCDNELISIKGTIQKQLQVLNMDSCLSESAHILQFRLLLLDGDVELNLGPGPPAKGGEQKTTHITELIEAFKSLERRATASEERLLTEMKAVRDDIFHEK